jgi:hypothetical protein
MHDLWARIDVVEPLGHELLREAKAAILSSPRSALLIAASAIETGVKMHISKIVPDASWLVREVPSPPVHKMLRTYIPDLHQRHGKPLADWQKLAPLFKVIGKLAEDRNILTHKGEITPRASANLPETLTVVSDMLYILDVLEGHEWAKGNVQHATRQKLGWPTPRRERFFVKMDIRVV